MTDRRLRGVCIGLCLVGLGIAGYLTYIHYAGLQALCLASGGCEKVQSSNYAEFAGLPVSLLGLVGYAGILITVCVRGGFGRMASACLSLIGFGFSGYLTYLELFRINAICQWCVASAVLMTLLAILTVIRLLSTPDGEAGWSGPAMAGQKRSR
jgi:uncharacterized membrane protein